MMTVIHMPGCSIAGYKLVTLLGKGQGGEVWSAVGKDGVVIALKLFAPATLQENAKKEYVRGKSLNHPNIVTPHSFGMADDEAFIVMPLIEGRSVDNSAGYFQEDMAWKLIHDIGSALAYLHSESLCHGDVKPSNILRSGDRFLLADFGSCFEIKTGSPASDLSSYLFSAPEEIKTEKSDIWSLGATVFNLVMGSLVLNGLGGRSQRDETEIPFMRKSMPELSAFVVECLSFHSTSRPSAKDVQLLAEDNLKRLSGQNRIRRIKKVASITVQDEFESFWPEIMKDAL